MIRRFARAAALLLALWAVPGLSEGVSAQVRAWLDRSEITFGETATLNIETTATVQQIDYRPLAVQFDLAGQTVRRSYERVNGRSVAKSLFAVGIRPRGPGVLMVPALRVGNATTAPQRLAVLPPPVRQAGRGADAFVEVLVDAPRPYVQQAVGMVVRLHYAVPLLSGQLDQDPVAGASLQRVGEDLQYQREIGGRRYSVVERRYLLVPERSGPLLIPGARFNGQAVGGFFDNVFDDGRKPLSAAAPLRRLQVQPIPAGAPQPWLPLHDLKLRYVQAPREARAGEAVAVELEAIADGASASQLPVLVFPDTAAAQLFAEPQQSDEQFIDGRPRTTVRRRISIVPLGAGALSLPAPRIEWWDAAQGVARTATLPPLELQVAPRQAAADAPSGDGAVADARPAAGRPGPLSLRGIDRAGPWLLLAFGVAAALAWRRSRSAAAAPAADVAPALRAPTLAGALRQGELASINEALCVAAGAPSGDLDAVTARLDDPGQAAAVAQLQSARWGGGDEQAAVAAMRRAFAGGARWRRPQPRRKELLPPLYPER